MIVFDLKCKKGHVFEAWFRNGKTYEAQAAGGEVVCPICGDRKIDKAPMAPNLASGRDGDEFTGKAAGEAAEALRALRAARDTVEKHFDHVGERFAEEARKIHYGEVEKRNIYGQATKEEARELTEEGVEFGQLPWIPQHDS